MQKKIGIILDNFGPSQMAYQALTQPIPIDWSVYGFYHNIHHTIVEPSFPLWHCAEAFNFNGHLIATNINGAQQLLNCFAAQSKIFYLWDIEWFRHKGDYNFYRHIYCNPNLKLVTRCEDYQNLVKQCWNIECALVKDFSYNGFIDSIFG